MAAPKSFSLLALAFVAVLALSSGPLRTNALVADRAQVARHVHARNAVAKQKRDGSPTSVCIPRSTSSSDTSLPTSTPPPPASTAPSSASATPSSASATPSSASSQSSGQGKWGLAWGGSDDQLAGFALSNVKYVYNWSPSLPSNAASLGLQGIPQLWGYDQTSQFQSTVVPGYASIVLGMNEPNEPSQSNMSPQDGAAMWMQYIDPLKNDGYQLISPACTDDDSGLQWYQEFFGNCSTCHFDGIAFHAYTANAQDLITYATTLHNTYNMNVWITEFADQNFSGTGGQPTMDDVWNFAGQVVDFVNNTPWIAAACPFGAMLDLQGVDSSNALMNSDGTPTALAYYYFG